MTIKTTSIVDPETISNAREVCQRLDPGGRRAWALEITNRVNGKDIPALIVDLKTGKIHSLRARHSE